MGAILKIRGEDGKVYEIPALGGGGETYTYLGDILKDNITIPFTAKGIKWELLLVGRDGGMVDATLGSGVVYGKLTNAYEYHYVLGFQPEELHLYLDTVDCAYPMHNVVMYVTTWDGSGTASLSEELKPFSGTLKLNIYAVN
jgi:hypothetical protein